MNNLKKVMPIIIVAIAILTGTIYLDLRITPISMLFSFIVGLGVIFTMDNGERKYNIIMFLSYIFVIGMSISRTILLPNMVDFIINLNQY